MQSSFRLAAGVLFATSSTNAIALELHPADHTYHPSPYPTALAGEGETCGGFNEFTGQAFPDCAEGLECVSSGLITIPGAGNVCVQSGASSLAAKVDAVLDAMVAEVDSAKDQCLLHADDIREQIIAEVRALREELTTAAREKATSSVAVLTTLLEESMTMLQATLAEIKAEIDAEKQAVKQRVWALTEEALKKIKELSYGASHGGYGGYGGYSDPYSGHHSHGYNPYAAQQ